MAGSKEDSDESGIPENDMNMGRNQRTYSDDITVLLVKRLVVAVLIPRLREHSHPQLRNSASQRTWVVCERVDWREAVEDDGERQGGEVNRE